MDLSEVKSVFKARIFRLCVICAGLFVICAKFSVGFSRFVRVFVRFCREFGRGCVRFGNFRVLLFCACCGFFRAFWAIFARRALCVR